mgnify:CR=1 FL=1
MTEIRLKAVTLHVRESHWSLIREGLCGRDCAYEQTVFTWIAIKWEIGSEYLRAHPVQKGDRAAQAKTTFTSKRWRLAARESIYQRGDWNPYLDWKTLLPIVEVSIYQRGDWNISGPLPWYELCSRSKYLPNRLCYPKPQRRMCDWNFGIAGFRSLIIQLKWVSTIGVTAARSLKRLVVKMLKPSRPDEYLP